MISMVTLPGRKRVSDDTIKQYCEATNLKLIVLRHEKGFGTAEEKIPVTGFQSVEISIGENKGRKTYQARPTKDVNFNDCMGRALVFEADRITGEMFGYLPDTNYNRKVLACTYYHSPTWTIVDAVIDSEIKAMADEHEKTLAKPASEKEIISSLDRELLEVKKQLAETQEKLKLQENVKRVTEEQKEPRAEKKETEAKKQRENVNVPIEDDKKPWEKFKIGQGIYKRLLGEAKKEIWEINKRTMQEIRDKEGRGWFASYRYKTEIVPLINQKVAEKINALNLSGRDPLIK